MKKYMVLFICAVILLCFGSCGKSQEDLAIESTAEAVTEPETEELSTSDINFYNFRR